MRRDDVKAIVITGAVYIAYRVIVQIYYGMTCTGMWTNTCCYRAGEKGKFSGGFDITAFGGLQGGKCMWYLLTSLCTKHIWS